MSINLEDRSDDLFRKLFARADLQIVHQAFQEDFPEVTRIIRIINIEIFL